MLVVLWFSAGQSCEEQGVGLNDPDGSLPMGDVLRNVASRDER